MNSPTSEQKTLYDLPLPVLRSVLEVLDKRCPMPPIEPVDPTCIGQLNFDMGRRSVVEDIQNAIKRKIEEAQEEEA